MYDSIKNDKPIPYCPWWKGHVYSVISNKFYDFKSANSRLAFIQKQKDAPVSMKFCVMRVESTITEVTE